MRGIWKRLTSGVGDSAGSDEAGSEAFGFGRLQDSCTVLKPLIHPYDVVVCLDSAGKGGCGSSRVRDEVVCAERTALS